MINSYTESFTEEEQKVIAWVLNSYEGENQKNPFYNAWDFRKITWFYGGVTYYGRRMKSMIPDVAEDNFDDFVESLYSLLTSKQRAT